MGGKPGVMMILDFRPTRFREVVLTASTELRIVLRSSPPKILLNRHYFVDGVLSMLLCEEPTCLNWIRRLTEQILDSASAVRCNQSGRFVVAFVLKACRACIE